MFVRNTWYAAAMSSELSSNGTRNLLARRILNEPLVIYRGEGGAPIALEDRCPHRFAPLSMGRLEGDQIECGYHGLLWNSDGLCARVPGRPGYTPPGAKVKSYPAVERWRYIWLWMGDPALADPALIPDCWRIEHPEWEAFFGDNPYFDCDYKLLIDNLLDPSHVAFVHRTTLGTSEVAEVQHQTERTDDSVTVTRWILDAPASPLFKLLGGFEQNVDRWQVLKFFPPGQVDVDTGSCIAGTGAPEGDISQGIQFYNYSFLTPMTETTSLYFWTHTRNCALGDAEFVERLRANLEIVNQEDRAFVEAAQRRMLEFPEIEWVNLPIDAGPLAARRMVDRMVEAEARGVPVPVSVPARGHANRPSS